MRRRFFTLDVFTTQRFAGNPLAVVLESEGLDTETMQIIAREFGHPETVFVRAPQNPEHCASLRIFTPASELPFAGHPTVGTAVLLGQISGSAASRFVLEEGVGPVPCEVDGGHATFSVPRMPSTAGQAPGAEAIAAALSLDTADIGFDGFTPSCWSAGNSFTFGPVRSLAAIGRARPNLDRFEAAFGGKDRGKAYLFCRDTLEQGHDFHTRMFAPPAGVPEDPATGSAAAAFPALLAASGKYRDGEHRLSLEQGYEMGRPSLIELSFTLRGGSLAAISIGGSAVVVTEGAIEA
jgi:trans-2,3-dihydro-3-hydroxyanthranilate isomerase